MERAAQDQDKKYEYPHVERSCTTPLYWMMKKFIYQNANLVWMHLISRARLIGAPKIVHMIVINYYPSVVILTAEEAHLVVV